VYDNEIAVADIAIAWIYGIAGAGLIPGISWGYKPVWIPGVVLLNHSLCFWFWTANQKRSGHPITWSREPARSGWFLLNFFLGVLAMYVAWIGG